MFNTIRAYENGIKLSENIVVTGPVERIISTVNFLGVMGTFVVRAQLFSLSSVKIPKQTLFTSLVLAPHTHTHTHARTHASMSFRQFYDLVILGKFIK